eukprot:1159236-Pelagomonas_calceolata.AAC.2
MGLPCLHGVPPAVLARKLAGWAGCCLLDGQRLGQRQAHGRWKLMMMPGGLGRAGVGKRDEGAGVFGGSGARQCTAKERCMLLPITGAVVCRCELTCSAVNCRRLLPLLHLLLPSELVLHRPTQVHDVAHDLAHDLAASQWLL